jgi:hypothetical protein
MARNFHIDYGAKGGPALMDGDTGLEVGAEPKTKKGKFKYESWANDKVERITPVKKNNKGGPMVLTPFFADTKKGIDHFTNTLKLEADEKLNPAKVKEIDRLNTTLKKAALDHHIEKIKGYNKNDKTTYPSDPKKRGHLLEADILERDLQLEKEKGRKFTTGKERDHFKYFTKYGEMLTPTKEEIEKSKGPSAWDTIYASFDINEKGRWNAAQRKRGFDGKTAKPLPKENKKSNPEPYTFHIDAEFLNGVQDRWNASTVNRDRLNELLLQSAFRKISEANQGIGNKAQRHIVAMNSGGPVDDGPPTLEQYLRLGLTLANLTDDEREVVRKLYEQTFKRNEK